MSTIAMISAFLVSMCGPSAARFAPAVVHAGERYDIDPRILASQMRQESDCDPKATGALGELGLMQLKHFTLATRGYDRLTDEQLRKPALNILLGARHLRFCLDKCGGSLIGALSLYKGLGKRKGKCRDSEYARNILARVAES